MFPPTPFPQWSADGRRNKRCRRCCWPGGQQRPAANSPRPESWPVCTEFLDNGNFVQEEYLNGLPRYDYYVVGNIQGQAIKVRYSDQSTIWETPLETECETHFRDGMLWQYYNKNGLTITQTHSVKRDYGKWHKVELIITNNSFINRIYFTQCQYH